MLVLAACSRQPSTNEIVAAANPTINEVAAIEPPDLVGGRAPPSDARLADTSAQGAAYVVQSYYALLERGRYREARKLWVGRGKASGMGARAFADNYALYSEYHAQVGAPGPIEGAAGSLFVKVPVIVSGRLRGGEEVHLSGPITLRRADSIPGTTARQRRWHIQSADLKPTKA